MRHDDLPRERVDNEPMTPMADDPEWQDPNRLDEPDVPFERPSDEPVGGAYGTPVDTDRDDLAPGQGNDPVLDSDVDTAPGRDAEPLDTGRAEPVAAGGAPDEDTGAVLFGDDQVDRFRNRWRELQADFVDDPKQAVRGADELVDEVMRTLSEIFAEHKNELKGQWQDDGPGETEELRVALRRYRSFFDQLLNA